MHTVIIAYVLVMMFPGHWNSHPLSVPGIASEMECKALANQIRQTESGGKDAGFQCYPYTAITP